MINIIINFAVSILVFWYWGNSDPSTKDGLFYTYFICSQIGFFFFVRKISKLEAEKDNNPSA